MNTDLMFSSKDQTWETPQDFFDKLNDEFDFTLDPCASHETAKCSVYFTEKENGLEQSWAHHRVYVNSPYGRELSKWVEKCYEESKHALVVQLLPARPDTRYFHDYIWDQEKNTWRSGVQGRFIKGRLKFGGALNAAPFPSMIVIYDRRKLNGAV